VLGLFSRANLLNEAHFKKESKYAYQKSPHLENTASPRSEKEERKKEHMFIRILISNKTPQTINEKENPWGYCLGTVSGKAICFKLGNLQNVESESSPDKIQARQT
jgi:hypothetical protein